MRRVVVTGMGIVSCLGNDLATVEKALRERRSGLRFSAEYAELGLRSQVAGIPDVSNELPVSRKIRRFMGNTALYAYYAMRHAIDDAGFKSSLVSQPRTGLIIGSGTGSLPDYLLAATEFKVSGLSKVLPYITPRTMSSTTSACLSTAFNIRGTSYSICAACATGVHCIGHAADLIRFDQQDIVFAGASEEVHWSSTLCFDAMGVLSTAYNDVTASRPFDIGRDGFVIAGGAGVLVLEEYEHAVRRGAKIYGEVLGHSASCDGADMVIPASEGAVRAMDLAIKSMDKIHGSGRKIDYINAHATSTPLGDMSELKAIQQVFGRQIPVISSTKGQTGHPIAASGAHSSIFCLLMMKHGFLAGCSNVSTLDPACEGMPVLLESIERPVETVMTNSFGFGGTNGCLIFGQID